MSFPNKAPNAAADRSLVSGGADAASRQPPTEPVVAAVVVRKGAEVSVEALRAFCGKRLAGFKVPKAVRFIDEIPRNSMGKIDKSGLRAEVAS